MNWKNGRKMQDELENIKSWYFEPRYQNDGTFTEEELIELSQTRKRLNTNQAR